MAFWAHAGGLCRRHAASGSSEASRAAAGRVVAKSLPSRPRMTGSTGTGDVMQRCHAPHEETPAAAQRYEARKVEHVYRSRHSADGARKRCHPVARSVLPTDRYCRGASPRELSCLKPCAVQKFEPNRTPASTAMNVMPSPDRCHRRRLIEVKRSRTQARSATMPCGVHERVAIIGEPVARIMLRMCELKR